MLTSYVHDVTSNNHWEWFHVASEEMDAVRQRLDHMKEHHYHEVDTAHIDNFLRAAVLGGDRIKHERDACKVCLAYWRHGRSINVRVHDDNGLGVPTSGPFCDRDIERRNYIHHDAASVGMGLDLDCLTSFMTNSAKERAIGHYFIHSADTTSQLRIPSTLPGRENGMLLLEQRKEDNEQEDNEEEDNEEEFNEMEDQIEGPPQEEYAEDSAFWIGCSD